MINTSLSSAIHRMSFHLGETAFSGDENYLFHHFGGK